MPAARKTSSARSLAPPFQLRPAVLGSQLAGRPAGGYFSFLTEISVLTSLYRSEQSPLCSDVFLCLRQERRHPPAPLLLLSNCDPLRWARSWRAAPLRRVLWIAQNVCTVLCSPPQTSIPGAGPPAGSSPVMAELRTRKAPVPDRHRGFQQSKNFFCKASPAVAIQQAPPFLRAAAAPIRQSHARQTAGHLNHS